MLIAMFITAFAAIDVRADLSKSDEQEINNYRLTEKNIEKFSQATKNLLTATQKNPKMFEEGPEAPEQKSEETLSGIVEAFDKIPDAKKAIQDAGMTTRDYWMFSLAMVYAATGNLVLKSGQKLPEGFSRENVEFYQANEAKFMALDKDLKAFQELTKKSSASTEEAEGEEEQNQ